MEKIIYEKGKLNKEDYKDRVKNYVNFAEDRFEAYCKEKGYNFKKLCLNADDDMFQHPIPHWGKLGLMKGQPDYFCYNAKKQFYCELKNSNKLKLIDLQKYCAWDQVMCDPKYTQYYICFMFKDKTVIRTIPQILELLPKSEVRSYHEGNKYYVLQL